MLCVYQAVAFCGDLMMSVTTCYVDVYVCVCILDVSLIEEN